MRVHQNTSDITAAKYQARVAKRRTDARAPPGPRTTDKSMAFINGVLICVRDVMAEICHTSAIKNTSAKLAACQSHSKAAEGLDWVRPAGNSSRWVKLAV